VENASAEPLLTWHVASTASVVPFRYRCLPYAAMDWEKQNWQESVRETMGFQDATCETEFWIRNPFDHNLTILLEHMQSFTQQLDLKQFHGDRLIHAATAGASIPHELWDVDYRFPVFRVVLPPGLNQFRIQHQSQDIQLLQWKAYTPEIFYSSALAEGILFGGFFSICFALAFYNLVIYFVTRETLHLGYFSYLSLMALAQAHLSGFLHQFVLPEANGWQHPFGISLVNIAVVATLHFVYTFLDIRTFPRWARFLVLAYCIINVMIIPLNFFNLKLGAILTSHLAPLISLYVMVLAVRAWRVKNPLALYFLIAWVLLIIGNGVQSIHHFGWLPDKGWIIAAPYIGATVEAIIISYALAHKIRLERLQETLRRRHAFSQLEKMVYPHQIERMKQGEILESTMPHAKSEAIVICLDIMGSTSSHIPQLDLFLRSFFDRCQTLISCDYRGQQLSAAGYRIKELGDGFLCSVGFPFALPPGQSLYETAMRLALGFFAAFDEEVQLRKLPNPTYCSIGIAEGGIQGFFTVSGIRSYELFGDSIVLATRYESLRKQWPSNLPGHMLTVQSRFYQSLPPRYQSLFTKHTLESDRDVIRNDSLARSFHRAHFVAGEAARLLITDHHPMEQSA
jgi:hypothetical protein